MGILTFFIYSVITQSSIKEKEKKSDPQVERLFGSLSCQSEINASKI